MLSTLDKVMSIAFKARPSLANHAESCDDSLFGAEWYEY
jgi:hypothetical protein